MSRLPKGYRLQFPADFTVPEVVLSAYTQSYHYHHCKMQVGEARAVPEWPRVIIFIPQSSDCSLQVGDDVLHTGDSLMITAPRNLSITCTAGHGAVLLVGGRENPARRETILMRAGDHYRVSKPWGHELWLNGEDPVFNFKEVYLKAGHQTSLQYHHFKEEVNLLLSGAADLVFNQNDAVHNDNVTPEDLGTIALESPTSLYIMPETLHRLRAKTDLYLYEVATPFLDDVIRVQDDSRRGDGRISAEHAPPR